MLVHAARRRVPPCLPPALQLRPTWILLRVRGLSIGLMRAQTALNSMGALMMQMRPSISG
jgi:hypothetical protein